MNPLPYTTERYADEADWKSARTKSVGASEAAAVCRLSKWCSPFALYFRKLEGRDEADDDNAGGMADWGHRHEPTIASWFLECHPEHGMAMASNPGDFTMYRSTERPYVSATVDRMVRGDLTAADAWYPLELKCAWYDAAREWKDRVPIAYQVQMQQQMYVTGARQGFFAVLLNGYNAKWFRVERHDKWIARMLSLIDEFWDRVQRRDPPSPDGHKADLARLFGLYPQSRPEAVDLPAELQDVGREWDKLAEREKAVADAKDKIKARVQQVLGERSLARCADDSGFSWKTGAKARTFRRVAKIGETE